MKEDRKVIDIENIFRLDNIDDVDEKIRKKVSTELLKSNKGVRQGRIMDILVLFIAKDNLSVIEVMIGLFRTTGVLFSKKKVSPDVYYLRSKKKGLLCSGSSEGYSKLMDSEKAKNIMKKVKLFAEEKNAFKNIDVSKIFDLTDLSDLGELKETFINDISTFNLKSARASIEHLFSMKNELSYNQIIIGLARVFRKSPKRSTISTALYELKKSNKITKENGLFFWVSDIDPVVLTYVC